MIFYTVQNDRVDQTLCPACAYHIASTREVEGGTEETFGLPQRCTLCSVNLPSSKLGSIKFKCPKHGQITFLYSPEIMVDMFYVILGKKEHNNPFPDQPYFTARWSPINRNKWFKEEHNLSLLDALKSTLTRTKEEQ